MSLINFNKFSSLQELVQNAEDAGATEMKILFDGRRLNTDTAEKLPYRKFCKVRDNL